MLTLTTLVLRWALNPIIGTGTVYITLFPAMVVMAVTFGVGPGLLGNAVGILLIERFLAGSGGHVPLTVSLGVRSGLMLLTTYYVGRVGERLRAARALADAEAGAAREAEAALRDADRRKTEFLGILSHELRNPLAPIRNSIYLLERAASGSEQATRAQQVLRRQAEHLTRLVDDLLDVTRISRGKVCLQCSRLDLREVVQRTIDDHRTMFAQAEVAVRSEQDARPVWIDADPTRIAQVLGNLLQNAVKFTQAGGGVVVTVGADAQRVRLSVRDDGAGIDPGVLSQLFVPFAQADQTLARTKGGLGLGLALVKGLVELHGGTVEALSDGVGRGAELVVRLPLAEAGAEPEPVRALPPAPDGRLVLVVEDNIDAGQSLADVLESVGHRVRVARDGASGLALARELRPDVVLCDIGLPDVDGYEIARALRRDSTLSGTHLVALSGYAQPEDLERSRDAGFDAHIAKPADIDHLMNAIASCSSARVAPGPDPTLQPPVTSKITAHGRQLRSG